jgi:acyl-CoA thioester hydrolase/thioesterase-3
MLAARYDQMKKDYKMSMEEFVNRGLNWFTKSFKVEYKRALKMGEIAIVKTQVESYNGATVVVNYWIYKKGETKIYVDGQAEFVLLSIQTGRPVRIPDDILQIYSV